MAPDRADAGRMTAGDTATCRARLVTGPQPRGVRAMSAGAPGPPSATSSSVREPIDALPRRKKELEHVTRHRAPRGLVVRSAFDLGIREVGAFGPPLPHECPAHAARGIHHALALRRAHAQPDAIARLPGQ